MPLQLAAQPHHARRPSPALVQQVAPCPLAPALPRPSAPAGELHTGGFVVGLGLVTCIIGNFSMLLTAGPYSEREGRQVRCSSTATAPSLKQSEENLRGTAGKSSLGGAGDSPRTEFTGEATEV